MSNCTHTIRTQDRYVDEHEDDWGMLVNGHWEYGTEESALEDLDLHRMRCRICGGIEYYSSSAREHYEGR